MIRNNSLSVGERVRIKTTGQEVVIDQVSEHGFAVIKFNSGGRHRLLNQYLEPLAQPVSAALRNRVV